MNDDGSSTLLRQKLMSADVVYLYKIPPLKGAGGHRYVTDEEGLLPMQAFLMNLVLFSRPLLLFYLTEPIPGIWQSP